MKIEVTLFSRRCLEVIITDICECELKRPRGTEPLKGIIDKLSHEKKVPSHIIASMEGLNTLSTFGTHPKEFDPEQVKPVLNNLTIIIRWYHKYKDTQFVSKEMPVETKYEDKKPVETSESILKLKKKLIITLSGIVVVLAVIITALFIFNIIGRGKQTKELEKSIAVLPFVNDSQDEENAHIINGLMEEILLNLQAIKDLKVPGRTSVEQYRNPTKSIPEIAKELGVNYVVEGSGQKYGNTIRLRVQLLDGAKGWHIWGDSYEEVINGPEDIFRIQCQIAQAIAAELKAMITPEEKQLIEKSLKTNLTAYDFYLRGREEYIRYRLDKENTEAFENAEKLYKQALDHDPAYARAFTGLAMIYWDKHYWGTFFTENFLDSVLILSDIALSYDDQLAEAYSLKGDYYKENANYKQAMEEYDQAIKINPNYWQAYAGEGELYAFLREPLKELEYLHIAIKLNHDQELPVIMSNLAFEYLALGFYDQAKYYLDEVLKLNGDSAIYFSTMAWIERFRGNYSKLSEYQQYAYILDSNNVDILNSLGLINGFFGQYENALKYYKKYIDRLEGLKSIGIRNAHRIGYSYWQNGFKEEADYYFNLQKKYCEESIKRSRGYASDAGAYFDLAGIYAFRGEKDKAYENLRLYNEKIGELEYKGMIWFFENDPLFNSIRNEPEFQEIFHEVEAKYEKTYEMVSVWLEENGML